MNIKVKTALIIIITLIIGILIGAMLNRALLQQRIRRAFSMQNPAFMAALMEEVIRPNPDQAKLIKDVLDKHAERMFEIREKFRKEMQSSVESLRKEMDSILTPEQKKRLENKLPPHLRRMRRFGERHKPFRRPPREKPDKGQKK